MKKNSFALTVWTVFLERKKCRQTNSQFFIFNPKVSSRASLDELALAGESGSRFLLNGSLTFLLEPTDRDRGGMGLYFNLLTSRRLPSILFPSRFFAGERPEAALGIRSSQARR